MISRMEQLESITQKILDKVERLERELCATEKRSPPPRKRSRSPSQQRKRIRSSSPPLPPQRRFEAKKKSHIIKITAPNIRSWTRETISDIFKPFDRVVNCYIFNDHHQGPIARLHFASEEGVERTLEAKDALFKEHGLTCTKYVY